MEGIWGTGMLSCLFPPKGETQEEESIPPLPMTGVNDWHKDTRVWAQTIAEQVTLTPHAASGSPVASECGTQGWQDQVRQPAKMPAASEESRELCLAFSLDTILKTQVTGTV